MNIKGAATVLLVALLMVVAVPVVASDGAEGVSSEDVTVIVPGEDEDEKHLSMSSGSSSSFYIYVMNNSNEYLSIGVSDISTDSFSTSSSVTVNNSSGSMMFPAGVSDGSNIAIIEVTVETETLADTGVSSGYIVLTITALNDEADTFTKEVYIEVSVTSVYTSGSAYNKFFGLFDNDLPSPLNTPYATAAITLVLWIIATIVMCELIIPLLARLVGAKKDAEARKKITHALTKTISLLMFVVAINECLNIVGANAEIMSLVSSMSIVLYVVIGSVIAWQVYVFIITTIIKGLDEKVDVDGVDVSLIPLFKLIGKVVICVLAATIILAVYGVDLAGIMVSAGVITLGITFGAQEIISQFFSGIVLLATRPFKKGDFINIGGTTYKVRKVRLMYTEFDSWDLDQVITMPNNAVTSATMINYTKGDANTRIYIYVTLSHDTDITKAKELMIQAANMHPHVIKDRSVSPPSTRLTNFLDSGLEYRLACYVDDYDSNSHFAGQIREIMYKLFKDNGIDIPYSKLDVNIHDGRKRPDDDTPDD